MPTPKRFIAGAVCPRCAQMDRIVMYTDDDGRQVRECVACGFSDALSEEPPVPELETRVNRQRNDDDHRVKQVVFFKARPEE